MLRYCTDLFWRELSRPWFISSANIRFSSVPPLLRYIPLPFVKPKFTSLTPINAIYVRRGERNAPWRRHDCVACVVIAARQRKCPDVANRRAANWFFWTIKYPALDLYCRIQRSCTENQDFELLSLTTFLAGAIQVVYFEIWDDVEII